MKALVGFTHLYRCADTDAVWTMTSAKMFFIPTVTALLAEFEAYTDHANIYTWNDPPKQKVVMRWWLTDRYLWSLKYELPNL